MLTRLSSILSLVVLIVAGGAAFAIAQQAVGGSGSGSAADVQYQGKRCGNPNTPQGVPPGNPNNADCPPQAGNAQSRSATPRLAPSSKRGLQAGCKGRGLRVGVAGADAQFVKSVRYRFRGRTLTTDTQAPFVQRIPNGLRTMTATLKLTATLTDGQKVALRRRLGRCASRKS